MIPRVGTALPNDGSIGELIKGAQTLLRAFGWDLGQFYDERMSPEFGPDWLRDLVDDRRTRFPDVAVYRRMPNLWDPTFGVNEPAHNDDSPLRACLGRMPLETWSKFKSIPSKFRNRAQHFDDLPALETLRRDAELIQHVASFLGLAVADEATDLIARVDALEQGDVFANASDGRILELTKQLEEYQAQHKATAHEVVKTREMGDAAKTEAETAAADLAVMAETIAGLEAALESQRNVERKELIDESLDLVPGDQWPDAPPARHLRLLSHVGDLYDPTTTDLLSNEFGPLVIDAADAWLRFLPNGGVVHLSRAGQAVAFVNGTWTYLGSLDDAVDGSLVDELG